MISSDFLILGEKMNEFKILNLLSIEMSNFKLQSLAKIIDSKFLNSSDHLVISESEAKKILDKYSSGEYILFKQKEISDICFYRLSEKFQEVFLRLYEDKFSSSLSKNSLSIWVLNGRQFLFDQNITNYYQNFYLESMNIMNIFSSISHFKGNIYFNETSVFFIKNLQEEHLKNIDANKRLRIRRSEIEDIKSIMIKENIQKFHSISIYWSGENPIFTIKENDIDYLLETIHVDGRVQSFKSWPLIVADYAVGGFIKNKINDGSIVFQTKDPAQLLKFLENEEVNFLDQTEVDKATFEIYKDINLENYINSALQNWNSLVKLRELSYEDHKKNLIGYVGELAAIHQLINDYGYDEREVYWMSETNYGSDHDIKTIRGGEELYYEVKSSTQPKGNSGLSSREYDFLNENYDSSFYVRIKIKDVILEKYSDISDKNLFMEFIYNDLEQKNIDVEFFKWSEIVSITTPYKYKVNF